MVCFGIAYLLLGLLILAAWFSEGQRRELLWFGLDLVVMAGFRFIDFFYPDLELFSRNGVTCEFLLTGFELAFLMRFILESAAIRRPRLNAIIWVLAICSPFSLLPGTGLLGMLLVAEPSLFLLSCLAAGITIQIWISRRRGPLSIQQHLFQGLLLILAGLNALMWGAILGSNFHVFQMASAISTAHVRLGSYEINLNDGGRMGICTVIVVLLLRRIVADRKEATRMAAEFEAARGIQQLLLSSSTSPSDRYTLDVVYLPAQEVGGDLYYVLSGGDGSFLLVAGGVSGKGLRAALQVSLIIGALRETQERHSPSRILSSLNRVAAGQTGGGFITCCCAHFAVDGTVTVANAGHITSLADRQEPMIESGLPLGLDPEADYAETAVSGAREWTFVSDGVIEAADAKGELYGFERTREIAALPAQAIAEAARAWGQNDDITVVTIRHSPA